MEKKKRKVVHLKETSKVLVQKKNSLEEPSHKERGEEIDSREKYLTIGDHLEELRIRIFLIIGVWLFFSFLAGFFIEDIHIFLVQPFKKISQQPLLLGTIYGPLEIYFKLALIIGILVSLPINLNILWGYVTPALQKKTAVLGHISIFVSSILFWFGVVFAWIYLFPFSLNMMLTYFLPAETIAQTTVEKYYSFLFLILIGTGLSFQLPLVVIFLGALEILTLEWHKKFWKFIIVILFVLSAFVTPPDPFSMFVMALPLLLLYLISVGFVWLIESSRKKS
ncbi:MAG: twin-arginine translocase subunit TatC [Leptonema sp. (in: bacteria)]